MMSSVFLRQQDEFAMLESISRDEGYPLVDPLTELPIATLREAEISQYVSKEGVVTRSGQDHFSGLLVTLGLSEPKWAPPTFRGGAQVRRIDKVPEGTFHGGRQTARISTLPSEPFYGGDQTDSEDQTGLVPITIAKHEERFVREVLNGIFDGKNDLGEIDLAFVTSIESHMPQTLRSLFIHKPGHNGGLSSLRHIFNGDKNGGRHVAAFEPGLRESVKDPWSAFKAIVSPDSRIRINFIEDEATGEKRIVPHRTSMFPVGMDSMAVLMAITDAWQHRLDTDGFLKEVSEAKQTKVYEVPIDVGHQVGELTVRLVTDLRTREDKIRTAFPIVS